LIGNAGGPQFLAPEEAFKLRSAATHDTIRLSWDIAPGYYLYKYKVAVEPVDPPNLMLAGLTLPPGESHHDEYFGQTEIYRLGADAEVIIPPDAPRKLALQIVYQGCADAGLCYPPTKETKHFVLAAANPATGGPTVARTSEVPAAVSDLARVSETSPPSADSAVAPVVGAVAAVTPTNGGAGAAARLSEQDLIARTLSEGKTGWIIATFFGFGLLLAFTPCVLPMIPILSSIIVGDRTTNPWRAFSLSSVYVLAMAATYSVAGVIAGLSGANLQAAFQDPWILGTFSLVFVLLALAMFGLYELQLPASWQTKLAEMSQRQRGGNWIGVGVMGVLSALIVGPCVAAPLAGALIYISQSGDAVLGGTALFAMSLGMGVPLLVVGTSAGALMPKVGPWMNAVKAVFGVILLGVAIYLLERIIPVWVALLLWAALFIVAAIYMGALDALEKTATGWRRLAKGLGLVVLTYGLMLMVGAGTGKGDLVRPLAGVFSGNGGGESEHLAFTQVKGPQALRAALQDAASSGRPVLLDYYADWCVSCKEMEKYTFPDARVRAALQDAILLQTDVTDYDDRDKALLKQFDLYGPPAILFFSATGEEHPEFRVVGFMNAEEFATHVSDALKKARG
ncbi:MAG: protein-disulfide reductase DsbD, partial [Pseudomonadota bacterium]